MMRKSAPEWWRWLWAAVQILAMIGAVLAVVVVAGAETPTAAPEYTAEPTPDMYPVVEGVQVTRIVLAYNGNSETRIWRVYDQDNGIVLYIGPDNSMQAFRVGEGR